MDDAIFQKCRELTYEAFGRSLNLYYTGEFFPAISITGSSCALNCRHCQKIMIERLPSATTPESLYRTCVTLHERGCPGALLTGGCDPDGRVPLDDFYSAIRKVKDETGMRLAAHTGVIGPGDAEAIKESGLDCVCVDVVGSVETSRLIYGIDLTPRDYEKTLLSLEKAKVPLIAPHVCVGLHDGVLFHEAGALDVISSITPDNVVIIGLTNLKGTPMEDVRIKPEDVASVLCDARTRFPGSFLSLGCARGKGDTRSEIDRLAVRAGVNNIAVPTPAARDEAEKFALEINEYKACCAFLPEDDLAFHRP